jgi:hypothetical protein
MSETHRRHQGSAPPPFEKTFEIDRENLENMPPPSKSSFDMHTMQNFHEKNPQNVVKRVKSWSKAGLFN